MAIKQKKKSYLRNQLESMHVCEQHNEKFSEAKS